MAGVLAVLAGSATACAEELSEREFLAEFPTVLSASRLRQDASETPQAVTVIDQAMIRASGAREFAELFRLVPGFTVSYVTYVKGLQPIVSYHGLGREFFSRLQVLIDGRSINNATLGGVDWSEFPFAPQDIDHIEVVRGPSNATHGIGAFLATINFITKHALQQRGTDAAIAAGGDGIRDASLRFGGGSGGFDYAVIAGHRADDGFSGVADARRRNFASARADVRIGEADSLMLQAGATDGDNEVGTGSSSDPRRDAGIATAYLQAKWDHSFNPANSFYVQAYHYDFRLDDRYSATLPQYPLGPVVAIDGGSAARRSDLEVQQNFSVSPSLRWVWGGSVREDSTEVPLLYSSARLLHVQRLFGHVEWRLVDALLANAGAMVEHNSLTGTDVAPQLALNFRLTPEQTLRLNVSRALRTPTVIENQGKFATGSPGTPRYGPAGDLLAETMISREVSYVAQWPERHATLDLKLFDDNVRNLIDLIGARDNPAASAFPKNAVNGDSARERGIEGQFTWRPSAQTLASLSASFLDIDSADLLDNYSRSAPRRTFHLLLSQGFAEDWQASLNVHRQSDFLASGNSEPQRAFTRVDARIARQVPLGRADGEVALSLENLFDNHYTEYRLDDVARRRVWLSLQVRVP
jgi:iron complex outermembrane receptor protein